MQKSATAVAISTCSATHGLTEKETELPASAAQPTPAPAPPHPNNIHQRVWQGSPTWCRRLDKCLHVDEYH